MRPDVHEALQGAMPRLLPLPVLGGTAAKVRALALDEHGGTDELVAVIEQDESFALNLLRFANSAAVRPIRARTVRHAVTLIGRRAVGRLALEAATYRFLEQVPGAGRVSRGQMHTHAVAVATAAYAVAERTDGDLETAHLAGLLHDIGKLVMPLAFGIERVEAIAGGAPSGPRRAAVEYQELGVDHAYAGAVLARLSDAGDDVCEAIHFHHGGRSGQESPSHTAACVQLANALVGIANGAEPADDVLRVSLERLGLPLDALDELAEQLSTGESVAASEGQGLAKRVAELERLAHVDELTGLDNRRQWMQVITAELAAGTPGSLLLCDVDRFKSINDSFGHRVGDLTLIEIGRRLRRHGAAGRLGGDEFAVWVRGDPEAGRAAADAIVESVARELAEVLEQPATVSIGIAASPAQGADPSVLLEAADRALYAAKGAGRNRAVSDVPAAAPPVLGPERSTSLP